MLKNLLSTFLAIIIISGTAFSQVGTGGLKGTITDAETGEPLPFVNLVIQLNGSQVAGGSTDFDGKYFIKPVPPGTYTVIAKFVGYQDKQYSGVQISEGIAFLDIDMSSGVNLEAVEIIEYVNPLIEKDQTSAKQTLSSDDILKMPGRSAASIAQQVGGVYSPDDGSGSLNIRGARSDANYYFIDGIKVRAGANNLPQSAVEQITVIAGGIPAQYGDVTGGVVSITTKGVPRNYGGSIEYVTSGYKFGDQARGLDAFGYNLVEFSTYGPLLWKKDTAGERKDPLVGFFLAGNYNYQADQRPSHLGHWKVKDEVLESYEESPLVYNNNGPGAIHAGHFIRMDDIENVRTTMNNGSHSFNIQGKLDFSLNQMMNLTFGGTFEYSNAFLNSYSNELMNWGNNPQRITYQWRAYGRFTQRFNTSGSEDESKASIIKNAFYSIQADYSSRKRETFDPTHRDNIFNYGYVGEFQRFSTINYSNSPQQDSTTGQVGYIHQTFLDTVLGFTPGDINPEMAAYTSSYYDLYGWEGYDEEGNPVFDEVAADDPATTTPNDYIQSLLFLQTNRGLRNGDNPSSIYGVWSSPGTQYNQYEVLTQNQFRLTATGSADIGDHGIQVGLEYEQREDRYFGISPNGQTNGVWNLGRQYSNSHIQQLDTENPVVEFTPGYYGAPTITYGRLNSAPGAYTPEDAQTYFDYNLRQALELDPDGNDFIDFDAIDPSNLALEYFSADELLNNGQTNITYYGYNHYGEKLSNTPTVSDYFTATDDDGNLTRLVDAYRPIYIAGYVQDKFAFRDLVFNVGLRVDRFDNNQAVLNDPFVLFPTVKANDQEALNLTENGAHPENIGEDWVVYVDNVSAPNNIVGYRDGNTWYNAEGAEIADPDVLATSDGSVAPLLVDKEKTSALDITSESFKDYSPQTNFMPRISFSFPISEDALFFAHYDVLTKRPGGAIRFDPTDYLFMESTTSTKSNPALLPETTIDYEVGFQQKITNSSALKMSAFYREFRDQVQLTYVSQAYPREYRTYGNIDFGTVKGMTFSYDLRQTRNLTIRASYTIQFAEGTGSDATTASALIQAGLDNLKVTNPMNFDRRHQIQTTLDYRYGSGKNYNGPIINDKQILANTGANLTMNAGSGTPYSGQTLSVDEASINTSGQRFLLGSINGNRLPWSASINARVDRDIPLTVGKNEKKMGLNVYFQILNVLNTRNIVDVYRYTGNPTDDAYLDDARWQNQIQAQNDEQTFRELYALKAMDYRNYNLPRRIRLGLLLNF